MTVNAEVIREQGRLVDPERDHIRVDGRALPTRVEFIYILLNKPPGYVTSRHDPHARNLVMDLVLPALTKQRGAHDPAVAGLHPVGRLDTQTAGLLILTNDGAFTHALTHPRHGVPKLYVVEVRGYPDEQALERLRTGIPLFGRRTLPARVRVVRQDRARNITLLEVELREGRQQQVRDMMRAVGHPAFGLTRTQVGSLGLGRLREGHWRFLTEAEVKGLLAESQAGLEQQASLPRPPRRPAARRPHPPPEPEPRPRQGGGSKERRLPRRPRG